VAHVPRTNTRRRYGRHPPVTVLFNTGVPPTVRPHQCSRIRSGHPEHLDRSALPHATANPQRPHHHERPRRQHLCPVMDATCSQNQTASSTQLSSFSTSFAHPLSFTYSSPGSIWAPTPFVAIFAVPRTGWRRASNESLTSRPQMDQENCIRFCRTRWRLAKHGQNRRKNAKLSRPRCLITCSTTFCQRQQKTHPPSSIWKRQSLTGRVWGPSPALGSANTLKLRHGRAFPKYRTVVTRPLHLCIVTSNSTQKWVTGLLITTSTG